MADEMLIPTQGEDAANLGHLIALLRREGRHSGVWFADHLLTAADHLEAFSRALTPASSPIGNEERARELLAGDPQTWSFRVLSAVRAEAAKVKQRDLAAHLGVSESRVSQMLKTETNPTIGTIESILMAVKALSEGSGR